MTVPGYGRPEHAPPDCPGEVCITCSDTAVQVTVIRLLADGLALVDTGQGTEEVSVALVSAAAGDTILVHAKEAIAVVAPAAAPPSAGSIESLYPFLYSGTTDLSAVLDQVRQSTVAKATEITGLRRIVRDAEGARLLACAQEMARRFAAGGRLLAFGNGGSATDAQQLATLFLNPPANSTSNPDGHAAPLPAFALTNDTSVVTALCNDIGVEVVFARQLASFSGIGNGGRDDIAVGLSTSGNSANLLRAFEEASRRGMLTIGLAGYDGGKMAELDCIDYLFVAPSSSIHRIQEAQTTTYQVLWELTQEVMADVPGHTR